MRYEWVMGVLLAGAASAQVVTVSECSVKQDAAFAPIATCQMTNTSGTPVASLHFAYTATEAGRSVPWLQGGYDDSTGAIYATIPGGIEPGETVPVHLVVNPLPLGADPARIDYVFEILRANDISGEAIN